MCIKRSHMLIGLLPLLAALILGAWQPAGVAAQSGPAWRDTGINLPASTFDLCADTAHPGIFYVNEDQVGTVAYNWNTGERTVINPRPFTNVDFSFSRSSCNLNGVLFSINSENGELWRYSLEDKSGRAIAHRPTNLATDGTNRVYALESGRLWTSNDGGLTWEERKLQLAGTLESLLLTEADARSLYGVAVDRSTPEDMPVIYTIYFSPDAGLTWQQRYSSQESGDRGFGGPFIKLQTLGTHTAPANWVGLSLNAGNPGSSNQTRLRVSADGARVFTDVGVRSLGQSVELYYTTFGLLRKTTFSASYSLSRSMDGGLTWQNLAGPPSTPAFDSSSSIAVSPAAPANVLLADSNGVWYSSDSGDTWRQFENRAEGRVSLSPYLPLTVLGLQQGRVYALDLPDAGKGQTTTALSNEVPGGVFFPESGHNLSNVFRLYWELYGGLAQFGYPRTEPFLEVSDTDGKAYIVQYFERNRFEYHPENAGTRYAVLLGLLGNQLTAERRAAGEAPFNSVPAPNPLPAGMLYFPETGHTLSGGFLSYWQANGGLTIYGYPISEPFPEVNPEDGKTYTVQYFERNRFEHHPENAGTPYEVLLGLLGNDLLRAKGWLP